MRARESKPWSAESHARCVGGSTASYEHYPPLRIRVKRVAYVHPPLPSLERAASRLRFLIDLSSRFIEIYRVARMTAVD